MWKERQAPPSDGRWGEVPNDETLASERVALFAELLAAFGRRDHALIRAAMRPDDVLVLPGSSPLAGAHRGIAEVERFVVAIRMVLQTGRHDAWSFVSASRSAAPEGSSRRSRSNRKTRDCSITSSSRLWGPPTPPRPHRSAADQSSEQGDPDTDPGADRDRLRGIEQHSPAVLDRHVG